jgi:hypothetical protein
MNFQLKTQPDSAGSSLPSTGEVKKSLNRRSLLLAPGLLGCLLAYVIYPPLDQGLLVTLGVSILFLPMLLQLRSIFRKSLSEDFRQLRRAFVYSSIALAMLALLLLLNGSLDRSPRRQVAATVLRKTSTRGRSATRYLLTVSSWRPGRTEEDFRVYSGTFNRVVVGQTITVEIHQGFLGLPWSGKISPH